MSTLIQTNLSPSNIHHFWASSSRIHYYPNPIYTSNLIFSKFTGLFKESTEMEFQDELRHIILCAYMQSGKTSTYQRIIHLMLSTNKVNHVVILCGLSDTELYQQSIQDTLKYNEEFYRNGRIRIYYNQHFKNRRIPNKDTLYIMDESDRDSTKDSLLHQLLSRHGIPIDGDAKQLKKKETISF